MDKLLLKQLKSEYGDAFYVLDSNQFKNNFNELKNEFSKIYPKFNIAYSYKTNYIPKLCKIVNQLGGYAEVVSEMELELAQRVGVETKNIIWNGPIKNDKVLTKFLLDGGLVNIDSYLEYDFIKDIVINNPKIQFRLGIRCNFDVKDGVISRFGFDVDTIEFNEVLNFVTNTSNVEFVNFQCHFAKRTIDYWPNRALKMIELIKSTGVVPKRIDLGGGLFGKMRDELKSQFKDDIPSYEEYAKSTATIIADYFKDKEYKPELIIEPGSALVGDCMKFVGTVKTIKNVRGKWFASVLGSQKNISMSGVNPPINIIHTGNNLNHYDNLDFVGFTCIEGDILYKNYNGDLSVDDTIIISNCGSYSVVMKPPFILPNFAIIDLNDGKVELIKNKESFDDIFHTYIY